MPGRVGWRAILCVVALSVPLTACSNAQLSDYPCNPGGRTWGASNVYSAKSVAVGGAYPDLFPFGTTIVLQAISTGHDALVMTVGRPIDVTKQAMVVLGNAAQTRSGRETLAKAGQTAEFLDSLHLTPANRITGVVAVPIDLRETDPKSLQEDNGRVFSTKSLSTWRPAEAPDGWTPHVETEGWTVATEAPFPLALPGFPLADPLKVRQGETVHYYDVFEVAGTPNSMAGAYQLASAQSCPATSWGTPWGSTASPSPPG